MFSSFLDVGFSVSLLFSYKYAFGFIMLFLVMPYLYANMTKYFLYKIPVIFCSLKDSK